MIIYMYWTSCKLPVILVKFSWNLKRVKRFSENSHIIFYQYPSSRSRVVPCGRTDGQTDITKLTVAFLNFVKESKNRIRQDILISVEIYARFTVFPQNLAITDCRKKFFFDGPGPLGRYALLIGKYLSTFRRVILPLY
jgi:hypothetical protein